MKKTIDCFCCVSVGEFLQIFEGEKTCLIERWFFFSWIKVL